MKVYMTIKLLVLLIIPYINAQCGGWTQPACNCRTYKYDVCSSDTPKCGTKYWANGTTVDNVNACSNECDNFTLEGYEPSIDGTIVYPEYFNVTICYSILRESGMSA